MSRSGAIGDDDWSDELFAANRRLGLDLCWSYGGFGEAMAKFQQWVSS